MLEAYDAGVPVISSDAGGCPELVEEYGGDLFPREDVPALTALLERHARERAPRRQVDLSAHHVDSAVAAMLDFYLRVIDHKRTAAHDERCPESPPGRRCRAQVAATATPATRRPGPRLRHAFGPLVYTRKTVQH